MKSECTVNFCDYDSLKHYDSGSFNSKYKTDLIGSIEEINKETLPDDIASSFLHKQYQTYKTLDELVLYRVFGLYSRTNGCKHTRDCRRSHRSRSRHRQTESQSVSD